MSTLNGCTKAWRQLESDDLVAGRATDQQDSWLTVILVAVLVIAFQLVSAQTAAMCLHGPAESADQQGRRRQALARARQINSAQVVAQTQTGTYQPLEQLSSRVTVDAQGFVTHLAVDANGYAFSIKDSLDPCGFGFFSDQSGVIYQGEALR
jgi:hypothetical protein